MQKSEERKALMAKTKEQMKSKKYISEQIELLNTSPKDFISHLNTILTHIKSEEDLFDQTSKTIFENYFSTLSYFKKTNDMDNYNVLYKELFHFLNIFSNYINMKNNQDESFLFYLAKNKEYALLSEVLKAMKGRLDIFGKDKQGEYFFTILFKSEKEKEKVNEIFELLCHEYSLMEKLDETTRQVLVDNMFLAKFNALFKEKQWADLLVFLKGLDINTIQSLVDCNNIYYTIAFTLVKKGLDKELELYLDLIAEKEGNAIKFFDFILNTRRNLLIYIIQYGDINCFEVLYNRMHKMAIQFSTPLARKYFYSENLRQNIFHLLPQSTTKMHRKDKYTIINKLFKDEKIMDEKVLKFLLNQKDRLGNIPLNYFLSNIEVDAKGEIEFENAEILEHILKFTDLSIFQDEKYLVINQACFGRTVRFHKADKEGKERIRIYSHPCESLLDLEDDRKFLKLNAMVDFLIKKRLFNPFIIHKRSSVVILDSLAKKMDKLTPHLVREIILGLEKELPLYYSKSFKYNMDSVADFITHSYISTLGNTNGLISFQSRLDNISQHYITPESFHKVKVNIGHNKRLLERINQDGIIIKKRHEAKTKFAKKLIKDKTEANNVPSYLVTTMVRKALIWETINKLDKKNFEELIFKLLLPHIQNYYFLTFFEDLINSVSKDKLSLLKDKFNDDKFYENMLSQVNWQNENHALNFIQNLIDFTPSLYDERADIKLIFILKTLAYINFYYRQFYLILAAARFTTFTAHHKTATFISSRMIRLHDSFLLDKRNQLIYLYVLTLGFSNNKDLINHSLSFITKMAKQYKFNNAHGIDRFGDIKEPLEQLQTVNKNSFLSNKSELTALFNNLTGTLDYMARLDYLVQQCDRKAMFRTEAFHYLQKIILSNLYKHKILFEENLKTDDLFESLENYLDTCLPILRESNDHLKDMKAHIHKKNKEGKEKGYPRNVVAKDINDYIDQQRNSYSVKINDIITLLKNFIFFKFLFINGKYTGHTTIKVNEKEVNVVEISNQLKVSFNNIRQEKNFIKALSSIDELHVLFQDVSKEDKKSVLFKLLQTNLTDYANINICLERLPHKLIKNLYPNQSIINSVQKDIISFNPFLFLIHYNPYYQYDGVYDILNTYYKSITPNKTLSKYINAVDYPMKTVLNQQLYYHFKEFVKAVGHKNLKQMLEDRSLAECLSHIIYKLLSTCKDWRLISKFIPIYVDLGLFDYQNKYNLDLYLLTVQLATKLTKMQYYRDDNNNKDLIFNNLLNLDNNHITYPSLDNFISSVSFILSRLLKLADKEYLNTYIKFILNLNKVKEGLANSVLNHPTLRNNVLVYILTAKEESLFDQVNNLIANEMFYLNTVDFKRFSDFKNIKGLKYAKQLPISFYTLAIANNNDYIVNHIEQKVGRHAIHDITISDAKVTAALKEYILMSGNWKYFDRYKDLYDNKSASDYDLITKRCNETSFIAQLIIAMNLNKVNLFYGYLKKDKFRLVKWLLTEYPDFFTQDILKAPTDEDGFTYLHYLVVRKHHEELYRLLNLKDFIIGAPLKNELFKLSIDDNSYEAFALLRNTLADHSKIINHNFCRNLILRFIDSKLLQHVIKSYNNDLYVILMVVEKLYSNQHENNPEKDVIEDLLDPLILNNPKYLEDVLSEKDLQKYSAKSNMFNKAINALISLRFLPKNLLSKEDSIREDYLLVLLNSLEKCGLKIFDISRYLTVNGDGNIATPDYLVSDDIEITKNSEYLHYLESGKGWVDLHILELRSEFESNKLKLFVKLCQSNDRKILLNILLQQIAEKGKLDKIFNELKEMTRSDTGKQDTYFDVLSILYSQFSLYVFEIFSHPEHIYDTNTLKLKFNSEIKPIGPNAEESDEEKLDLLDNSIQIKFLAYCFNLTSYSNSILNAKFDAIKNEIMAFTIQIDKLLKAEYLTFYENNKIKIDNIVKSLSLSSAREQFLKNIFALCKKELANDTINIELKNIFERFDKISTISNADSLYVYAHNLKEFTNNILQLLELVENLRESIGTINHVKKNDLKNIKKYLHDIETQHRVLYHKHDLTLDKYARKAWNNLYKSIFDSFKFDITFIEANKSDQISLVMREGDITKLSGDIINIFKGIKMHHLGLEDENRLKTTAYRHMTSVYFYIDKDNGSFKDSLSELPLYYSLEKYITGIFNLFSFFFTNIESGLPLVFPELFQENYTPELIGELTKMKDNKNYFKIIYDSSKNKNESIEKQKLLILVSLYEHGGVFKPEDILANPIILDMLNSKSLSANISKHLKNNHEMLERITSFLNNIFNYEIKNMNELLKDSIADKLIGSPSTINKQCFRDNGIFEAFLSNIGIEVRYLDSLFKLYDCDIHVDFNTIDNIINNFIAINQTILYEYLGNNYINFFPKAKKYLLTLDNKMNIGIIENLNKGIILHRGKGLKLSLTFKDTSDNSDKDIRRWSGYLYEILFPYYDTNIDISEKENIAEFNVVTKIAHLNIKEIIKKFCFTDGVDHRAEFVELFNKPI
jgi:hypothetical protein